MLKTASERLRNFIDRVGRENELNDRELARIRAMFIAKGISLDAEAAPYTESILDTVRNLRSLAESAERAETSASNLRESQAELQVRLQDALRRLQAASNRLQEQAAAIRRLKVPASTQRSETADTDESDLAAPSKLVLVMAGIPVVSGPRDLQ